MSSMRNCRRVRMVTAACRCRFAGAVIPQPRWNGWAAHRF